MWSIKTIDRLIQAGTGRPGLRNKIPGAGRLIRAKPVIGRPGLQKVVLCYPLTPNDKVCKFNLNFISKSSSCFSFSFFSSQQKVSPIFQFFFSKKCMKWKQPSNFFFFLCLLSNVKLDNRRANVFISLVRSFSSCFTAVGSEIDDLDTFISQLEDYHIKHVKCMTLLFVRVFKEKCFQ